MPDDKTAIKERLTEWLPQLGYVEIEERRLKGYSWLLIAREASKEENTKGLAIHAYQLPGWPDFFEFRFEFVLTESDRDSLRRLDEVSRKNLLLQLQSRTASTPGVSLSYHFNSSPVPTAIMVSEKIAYDGFSKDRVITSTETLRAVFGFAMMILDVAISPPTVVERNQPIGPLN